MTDLTALGSPTASYTSDYTFVQGAYAIGKEHVPYFAISMSVADAVGILTLARDLVFDPNEPVRLEELLQRDLDEDRATKEIVDYLKQAMELKFFNSFTVALLPVEPGDRPVPLPAYPEDDPSAPPPPNDELELTQVGPVRIRRLKGERTVGRLSWNTRRTRAVIIDGQHRFFALKSVYDQTAFRQQLRPETTQIPVLVLVLDKRAGFEAPDTASGTSVARVCRKIFIDLNKNARQVKKARQYLLDDRSLNAVAMRSLIGRSFGGGAGSANSEGCLPLALVDWYTEQAKFDKGLHVTTVVTLHDMVETSIDAPPPKSSTDYVDQRRYVERLESRLGITDQWDGAGIRARIDSNEQEQLPFMLMDEEIAAAARTFATSLGKVVAQPLLRLRPYRDLADRYRGDNLLDGEDELWLGHDNAGKAAFVEITGRNPAARAETIAREVKGNWDLAYQAVFQKGFVRAAVQQDNAREILMAQWADDANDISREAFLEIWAARFDRLIAPWLTDHDYWRGPGIAHAGTIDYSQPAPPAIAGWITLAMTAPFDTWIATRRQPEFPPAVNEALKAGHRAASPSVESAAGNLASSVDPFGSRVATQGLQKAAAAWLWDIVNSVKPGRPPNDPLPALWRMAVVPWRNQMRKYLRAEAKASGYDDFDEGYRDAYTVAHGARRLAATALRTSPGDV